MSRDLTPRAIRNLLDVGAPLKKSPELAGLDIDRYDLGDVLGTGGMGIVYEAYDKELQRKVALKVFSHPAGQSDTGRQRFLREAKAAARLSHPHIATVYDATPEAIAMQRIEGVTLSEYKFKSPRDIVSLVRDAALAIHFAHAEGIVHRDLKPANMMVEVGAKPHIYVMDFGLAKELSTESSLSLTGAIVGTPAYMAPEQASGQNNRVGTTTDVYGLGATLYASLAGRAPFHDDDVYKLLRKVVEEEPIPLTQAAQIDRDLSLIVAKSMAKEPERRYNSALALASDLDRWLRGEPIEARPPSAAYRFSRFVSRRQGAILTGAVAALIVFFVSLPFFIHSRGKRQAAEEQHRLLEQVLDLSQKVSTALHDAMTLRKSGAGHELNASGVLETTAIECIKFLEIADVAHVHLLLGRLRRAQFQYRESIARFDRAAEILGDVTGLHLERGLALAAIVRDEGYQYEESSPDLVKEWQDRATDDLQASLANEPANPTADWIFAMGQLHYMRGDLGKAVSRLKEVLERDITHQEAHLSLSRIYHLQDNQELGFRHSVIALDLQRGYQPTYIAGWARGKTEARNLRPQRELLRLEGINELWADFNLLLQQNPGEAYMSGMKGQVKCRSASRSMKRGDRLQAQSDLEQAIFHYSSALNHAIDDPYAHMNRAICQVQMGQILPKEKRAKARSAFQQALQDFNQAIETSPGLAVAYFNRALLYERRAFQSRISLQPQLYQEDRLRASTDAQSAVDLSREDHPFYSEFQKLATKLKPSEK